MTLRTLAACAGLALGAAPAVAQDALGDGRALDANLQVGSGGRNPEPRDFRSELAYRNAIVTGNVPGGFAFRGDVGYSAANDFRGATAADDIFAFQRDAFFSGLATRGLDGISSLQSTLAYSVTGQSRGLVGDVIINRPYTGSTADDLTPRAPGPQQLDIFGAIGGTLRSPSASALKDLQKPAYMNTLAEEGTGRAVGYVGASDLLGVRVLSPSNAVYGTADPLLENDILARLREDPTLTIPAARDRAREREDARRPDRRLPSYENLLEELGLSTRVQESIDGRVEGGARDGAAGDADRGFPLGGDPLAPVRRALREAERRANPYNRVVDDGVSSERDAGNDVDPLRPVPLPDTDGGGADRPADEQTWEETLEERIERAIDAAENVLGRSVDLNDMGSGSENPAFRRHFDRGVELLGEGRYFDAEERFAAALQLVPGEPMAAIGRLHAQIGGGMFLSAGANLRRLFTAYPELMAARVDERFLPGDEELDGIRALLRTRMSQTNMMNSDAAAVLAYLGVQTGNRDDVEDGLDRFRELSSDPETGAPDTFARLLEAAWRARIDHDDGAGRERDGEAP